MCFNTQVAWISWNSTHLYLLLAGAVKMYEIQDCNTGYQIFQSYWIYSPFSFHRVTHSSEILYHFAVKPWYSHVWVTEEGFCNNVDDDFNEAFCDILEGSTAQLDNFAKNVEPFIAKAQCLRLLKWCNNL